MKTNWRFAIFIAMCLSFSALGCSASTDDLARAIEDYNEVIRLNPEEGQAYFSRGIANTLLSKDVEALQDIERAVELGLDRARLEAVIKEAQRQR